MKILVVQMIRSYKNTIDDEAKKLYQFGYKEILPQIKRAENKQVKCRSSIDVK